MNILGINSVYHESSACLLRDGELVAVAEEERFNRVKHGKQARADNPDELPRCAIEYCLKAGDITLQDVDHVAVAGDPQEVQAVSTAGRPSPWNDPADQALFLNKLPDVPKAVAELGYRNAFHWVPHHTAHAASAFFVSPFTESGVLVVDALGDDAYSTRTYHGRASELHDVACVRYPSSIGYLWELCSVFLGFGVYEAAKIMGLAGYGDPSRFAKQFDELAWIESEGGFAMAHDLLRFSEIRYYPPSAYCNGLEHVFGIKPRATNEPLLDVHRDLAAALQAKTNSLVLDLACRLHAATGSRNLCLAGGVALNCVTNEHIFTNGPYHNLYIQPAAHDGGLSLGAAMYVWNVTLGQQRRTVMRHAYWGPSFSNEEIEDSLRRSGLRYEKLADIEQTVARLISEENVVGFFHGAMELGPRALGARSILADPRHAHMREVLNHKVKHREYFRPFAPSVLEAEVANWFDFEKDTLAADFMLMAYRVKQEKRKEIEAVLHVDGTCRIQVVRKDVNSRFHRIISEFAELTGVPMVLNTSFNDQEPIICTPADALETFVKTEIDYLAMGDFLVAKDLRGKAQWVSPHL